ncbi:MAG: hypothetical protein GY742_21745 [Hyphomicrobiales bacterium]|nr:hypothetical protein [Hyphomicrobiales bacterium]
MFKKSLLNIAIVCALASVITLSSGKTVLAQGMLESCAEDIVKYCDGVTPGNGHIASCLYAREDQISDQCGNAFEDVGDVMDTMFSTIRYALATCAEDIGKFCAGTKFGQGRLFTCLNTKKAEIGGQCKAVVDEIGGNLVE